MQIARDYSKHLTDCIPDVPAYVPTQSEMAEVAKLGEKLEWWQNNGQSLEADGMWSDGFSLREFCAGSACTDLRKQIEAILDGHQGWKLVLVDNLTNEILAINAEEQKAFGQEWRTEWKWIVRRNGKMFKDASGKWAVYPHLPKRESTHTSRGVREVWALGRYELRSRGETLGSAMKRGIMTSDLERVFSF